MEYLKEEIVNRILYIRLNRPEKRNALNPKLIKELTYIFQKAILNEDVKIIVLGAAGNVFSAGADLDYLQKLQSNTYEENVMDSTLLKDLFYLIYTCPKITIAQVEGDAIAGGCGLASVCDFIFSTAEAKYGYTEVKIGFIPAIVSCFLILKIGGARTRELLLSGELISAEKAEKYNLINFISDKENIKNEVTAYAENLARSVSANSVKHTKKLLGLIEDNCLEKCLDEAVRANARARDTDDCRKGISAFLNKKKIEW